MKYICGCEEEDTFYASYGSFMHKLLEGFYKGELSKDDMLIEFLTGFSENVKGIRPQESTVQKYIKSGTEYLKSFKPIIYDTLGVEMKLDFYIDGIPFTGIIDFLGEKDGEYYIVDHKSRELKPRGHKKRPTKKDEELDSMLRQLYLYAIAVKQTYGKYPKSLCFNCFRNGEFIEEPFNEDACNEAVEWVKKEIEEIENTNDFYPNVDFFSCRYLCGVNNECVFDEMARGERRMS